MNRSISYYYNSKFNKYKNSHLRVDWKSKKVQYKRLSILLKIIDREKNFTITDYGSGTGELINFLKKRKYKKYYGYDVSSEMVNFCKKKYKDTKNTFFFNSSKIATKTDFLIASGVFNVRLNTNINKWEKKILKTIEHFNNFSKKGFSFNFLTSYSDPNLKKKKLYYAKPEKIFNYCKKKYKDVFLIHDFELYDFFIFVKK